MRRKGGSLNWHSVCDHRVIVSHDESCQGLAVLVYKAHCAFNEPTVPLLYTSKNAHLLGGTTADLIVITLQK